MNLAPLWAAASTQIRGVRHYVTQVMSVEETIRHKLTDAFDPAHLYIRNDSSKHAHHAAMVAQGGGNGETRTFAHSYNADFFVEMVSSAFQGKSFIARHRAVNSLLAPEFDRGMHALSLRLKTPEEVAREQSGCCGGTGH